MLLGLRLECHKMITLAVVAQPCTSMRYMSVSVELNSNNYILLKTVRNTWLPNEHQE